jgi:hypothetical protein
MGDICNEMIFVVVVSRLVMDSHDVRVVDNDGCRDGDIALKKCGLACVHSSLYKPNMYHFLHVATCGIPLACSTSLKVVIKIYALVVPQ